MDTAGGGLVDADDAASGDGSVRPAPSGPPQERGLGALTLAILAVPVVALVALVVAFGVDAMTLRTAAADLETRASAAQDALAARDAAALEAQVDALQEAARDFTGATDGPHWWIATHLVGVRDQAVPLVAAGAAAAVIADDVLAPLAQAGDLGALSTPTVTDGRIDPLLLEPYRPALATAAEALDAQVEALAAVEIAGTVDLIREPFVALEAQVGELAATVDAAHATAELLPAMLGADEPRTYVVVVQNNAEPRASGGIPGAFIELTADDGRLSTGAVVPAFSLEVPDQVAPLTGDELTLYTERMAIFPQDINFTPEFPRAAELAAAFWARGGGGDVDGVLSLDPVALSWMLGDAPPVEVDGITLAGDTLAETLLNGTYYAFETPREQDAFFADAARALFGQLLAGTGSAVDGVSRAIDAHRFMLWSAHENEQDLLADLPISGDFLEDRDALGVFLNDGSGSKIGYYVDTGMAVTDLRCADGSVGGQSVEVTLTHTYDGDVADLPDYVGVGGGFVPAGQFHANVIIYPPDGMRVAEAWQDGDPASVAVNSHDGRQTVTARVVLDPGDQAVLEFRLEPRTAGLVSGDAWLTPGPRAVDVERVTAAATGC
ncbi:DUF4012 domain-containing protein [Demequina sp. SYSU T00068]|uniref:DUF4012 domain-containing protein n=1 Tax=Demequina lignilytica TaxID=3051663 RepID=UPI00262CCBE9|nr:DUF4012 domain-containing protein [Demequina sp. SYSU T00068]MDN4490663.1 DUF4012 domain-containing protein [Demequina sp. SYSU T00068]